MLYVVNMLAIHSTYVYTVIFHTPEDAQALVDKMAEETESMWRTHGPSAINHMEIR